MTPAADSSAPVSRRLTCLALALALFASIWGAKLIVIDRFGTDLPYWDQWEKEGMHVFPAWFERGELWGPLFVPHNEHRIVPTLLVNLGLAVFGGQWDARAQCIVSAAIHAAIFAGFFLWALRHFSRGYALLVGLLLAALGAAPIAWENILSGFQSQFYFLAGFSLLAIHGLLSHPALSPRWWLGFISGALALVSMGSGLLCALPVFLVAVLRLLRPAPTDPIRPIGPLRPIRPTRPVLTLTAALLLLAAGFTLHTSVPGHATLRATSIDTFLLYAARCLSWPHYDLPWLGVLLWLPWLVHARSTVRAWLRRSSTPPDATDTFLFAAGLWVLIQIAAVAYSRANAPDLPATRYGDLCAIGLALSALSLVRVCVRLPEPAPAFALWSALTLTSLATASHFTWTELLPAKKRDFATYERNVHQFVLTDDSDALLRQKEHLPFPDATWLANILRRPSVRALLPACVRPPLPLADLADGTPPAPPLPGRATRTLTQPGEWRSAELPAGNGWWKFETAGQLGAPGTSLELVSVRDHRVLSRIAPARPPLNAWRSVYVPAPNEPSRLVARTDRPENTFAFTAPVETSAFSYRARAFAKSGWLLLTLGVATLATVALAHLLRRRSTPIVNHNSEIINPLGPSPQPSSPLLPTSSSPATAASPLSPAPRHSPAPSMRFFTVRNLLALLVVSAVVAVPFLPAAKTHSNVFLVEATVTADQPGIFHVYFDDGSGISEKHSTHAPMTPGAARHVVQLALPAGTFKAFRVDPTNTGGHITLHSLRVVSAAGWLIREIPLSDLVPFQQIDSARLENGALRIVVAPGATDPQFTVDFAPNLVVTASWRDFAHGSWRLILPIFATLAGLLLLVDRSPRTRAALATTVLNQLQRPQRAIALIAALAVAASAYPVLFLGRSYVSPNYGTPLLYDNFPTLPGYKSDEVSDPKMSDVGAVIWQHVPFSMIQQRALASGELPLWNRYNAAGVPLLAQGQSMFGDPLHLLVIAAKGAAWAWDAKYLLAKWLFATALGLTVFALLTPRPKDQETKRPNDSTATPAAKSLGPLGPWSLGLASGPLVASLLVAAAAPFIGFFVYRINHPAFFSLCYAPWPLYFLLRLGLVATSTSESISSRIQSVATTLPAVASPKEGASESTPARSRFRPIALHCLGLLIANLALMNSGTVKEAYMLLVCVNLAGGCALLALAPTWPDRLLKTAAVLWTGLLFVLLTAPIWAIFLQTLKQSYTGYNAVSAYQIQPTLLLGFFDEIFYRPLMGGDRVFNPSLNLLLLSGVLYFLVTLRLQFARRGAMALALASLLPLSLAFGLLSPHWVVHVPFLANVAHLDNTFSCALIVLWSVLAGVGFATAFERLGTPEGRHDLILAGLALAALVFGWIAFGHASHRPILGPVATVNQPGQVLPVSPFIWHYLWFSVAALTLLAIALHRTLARRCTNVGAWLMIGLCAAMLLWRHGLHARAVGFESFTVRPADRADFHARSDAMEFARAAHAREPGRGYGIKGNFFPGWTGVYGLETIHGPDALVNPWLRELVGVSGVERIWDWRLYCEPAAAAAARPFFDALNVRHYFDLKSVDPVLTQNFKLVHRGDLDVYESPTAWPRAFFTDRLDVYAQPAELIPKFNSAQGRPFAAIQRPDLPADLTRLVATSASESKPAAPATDYRLTENATSFRIRASAPGVIVLTEAFWRDDSRAELNGTRVPVFRVNHAFRGIHVPAAGDYTVTFYYWPRNFVRYLTFSGIAVGLIVISLFFSLRPVRSAPHRSDKRQRIDSPVSA